MDKENIKAINALNSASLDTLIGNLNNCLDYTNSLMKLLNDKTIELALSYDSDLVEMRMSIFNLAMTTAIEVVQMLKKSIEDRLIYIVDDI